MKKWCFLFLFITCIVSEQVFAHQKKHIILSIDGGGVRGIIPAMILEEIEKRTKKPIHKMIDIISGNSTGGIIALALVTPEHNEGNKAKYTAADLVNLYKNQSQEIFSNSIMRKLTTGFNLWGPKYSRENLDRILEEKFGDTLLSQTLKHILIFTYNLEIGEARIWSSRQAKLNSNRNSYLKYVAAATSAAPTYFDPVTITNVNGSHCCASGNRIYDKCTEIDGGTFANNPSIITLAAILRGNPDLKLSDIILISLGTGKMDIIDSKKIHNSGMIGWIKDANIIDLISTLLKIYQNGVQIL